MRISHTAVFLLLAAGIVTFTTALATRQTQINGNQPRANEDKAEERLNKLPVADYEARETADPEKQEKRRIRNKRYDDTPSSKINPNSKFVERVSSYDWELGLESALPVSQSTAIVIGKVIDAKAFLSDDKSNVYSEFTVQVEKVIKNDGDELIVAGNSIDLDRVGGRVRIPSGHVQSYTVRGRGTPQVGLRYVFFLGYNKHESAIRKLPDPREMNRHILTAYELRDGKVAPLDNAGGRNFKAYEGVDETELLNEIQTSLTQSPNK